MREFILEVQAVIDKWRKTISEGGEFIEAEVRREIIRAGGYKLGVGETDRAMRAIKEPFKIEDRIREIAREEAGEALGVTPEVTVNKELLALEFIRDSPTKLLKRKNLYGEFGEDFIEGLHTRGYITHTLAPDTFLITREGRAYIDEIARGGTGG